MQGKTSEGSRKRASAPVYVSPNQLVLEGFEIPFDQKLTQVSGDSTAMSGGVALELLKEVETKYDSSLPLYFENILSPIFQAKPNYYLRLRYFVGYYFESNIKPI